MCKIISVSYEHSWERSKARAMEHQHAFTGEMKVQFVLNTHEQFVVVVSVVIYSKQYDSAVPCDYILKPLKLNKSAVQP